MWLRKQHKSYNDNEMPVSASFIDACKLRRVPSGGIDDNGSQLSDTTEWFTGRHVLKEQTTMVVNCLTQLNGLQDGTC